MSIYTPGCGTPPPPTCADCNTVELGRIRGFALINQNYTFSNYQNKAEWDAAILAGNVYVFPYANGTLDSAENLSDSYGSVPQQLDSYTFNLNLHEPGYSTNIPFWNFMKNSRQYLVAYKTETKLAVSSVAAQIFPKIAIASDPKSKVDNNIMISFVQNDIPVPMTAPVGVFENCEG